MNENNTNENTAKEIKQEKKKSGPLGDLNTRFELVRMLVAILIGVLITAVVIFAVSETPIESLRCMFFGPLERPRYLFNVLELMVPLIFTGVAISIVFTAQQFNLAAEGIFYFGGMVAAVLAIVLKLPRGLHAVVCITIAGLIGGLIGLIPGLLKYKWQASELVISLMLNYVCFSMSMYVIKNHFRDKDAGAVVSYVFEDSAVLTKLVAKYRLTIAGAALALLVCVLAYFFLFRTRYGFTLRAAGENMNFTRYAGLNVAFAVVGSQVLSGMVAGVGGAVEMLSMYNRFQWTGLTGYGWDGVIVAIFAKNNPKYVPLAAGFLAWLRIGADIMLRRTGVQMEIVKV
ncbi:MAG: ABC transporter permease, partial [Clostridia bacterium]|nr:ABC transporter permease [Clostridia bacterium]